MKTSAEKSSTTTTPSIIHRKSSAPFFSKAGGGSFFPPAIQMKMAVSQPGDKHEQEADRMADKVMRMPSPGSPSAGKEEKLQRQPDEKIRKKEEEKEKVQKAPAGEEKLQRKENEGTPAVNTTLQSAIQGRSGGGQPLPNDVRSFMEPRFNADFSNVRIHSDQQSAALSNQLSARAFTHRNNIFFSRNQYQPGSSAGRQLLAHELTHTIQQGHAVQRSPQVSTSTTPPTIQRFGIQDALDKFAEWAANIPGFTMLTVVMGFNPVNMRKTDRSAANILRAVIGLVPGGNLISQVLDNHGVINKAATWIEQKLAELGDIGSEIVSGLKQFMDSLSWSDIFDLGGVWERAKSIFTAPIGRLISFGASVVTDILKMVKEAILKPLAALAEGTRGYDLLKAILGEDPITGEAVPRNADTLIGGFMKLIGQEEIWENIKKGNAIARAWAWFQGVLTGLMGFVRSIPQKIISTITSLTFLDIVTVAGAFIKIAGAFVNIAVDFVSWGLNQVISLLEILFSVVAPGVMPYIKKAQAAFITIVKNPIGFVGNLVRAGRQGFQMFSARIVTHLKTALIKWITGPLGDAGVYIPKSFDLMEIIKLVLSVLGLTWQNIRSKLVKIIPEPVLVGLEKTAGILVTLVKDGPAAAWEQIKAELSELKSQLIAQVTEMIATEVVKAAVMKLVSMLNPAGAVIQAIIAIYNTITFFIEKIQQIAAVVASFVDSISEIASGQVDSAAKKVEDTMANTLVVIIAFLAKFAGLGNIPNKIVGIVKKIRQPIDKGLDKIVAWLGKMLAKAKGAIASVFQWWKMKVPVNSEGASHSLYFTGDENSAELMVASNPKRLENFLADARKNTSISSDPLKEQALTRIDAQVPILRKARADLRLLKDAPEDQRQPSIDILESILGKIGAELAIVLKDSTQGVKSNAIHINWPKPAYSDYPKLYLYYLASHWKISAKSNLGTVVAVYHPDGGHIINTQVMVPPAELGSKLGIKGDSFQIEVDKVIGPIKECSTPGGGTINSLLERYGWNASDENMDGDHVQEIQFGGEDKLANLWPLNASMNRGAGSILSKQQVELDNQKVTIDWLKKVEKKPEESDKKYFFLIDSVKTNPA